MRIGEALARVNRLQQARLFKIVATCVVVALAITGIVAYAISVNVPSESLIAPEAAAPGATGAEAPGVAGPSVTDKTSEIINGILRAKQDPTGVGIGIGIAAALCIGVIWLGLGLTYLALGLGAGAVLLAVRLAHTGEGVAVMLVGTMALTASFTALMKLVGMALSAPSPVLAIARNVLSEAARMKISLVFIVMLIFGLAALPGLLEANQPLRYRIQAFLQYGTSGAFWLIAVLVLVFSASSVAFEQRDKVIWQTMTKPVAAWQYILGKWLGVVALAAVLLAVSGSGVFLFTEYLRGQPAYGEKAAYVTDEGGQGISEDRFILDTQVLTARATREADPPELEEQEFATNVRERADEEINQLRNAGRTIGPDEEQDIRAKIRAELPKAVQMAFRSIEPAGRRDYSFSGLGAAREANGPVLLRFKINAGANSPDALYKITLQVQGEGYRVIECPLGETISLRPPMLPSSIDANGVLRIRVTNGDEAKQIANPETISFPPGGLEISYSSGGYRANFARVVGVLWVKLAFLAMLAICASTFLSFPVACLVAFTVFLAAEGSGFILQSLDNYQTETREGKTIVFNTIVNYVAMGVAYAFKVYGDLKPTERLVDGVRLSWTTVAGGTGILGLWTLILYLVATVVFRRRELATYSGQ